MGCRDDDDDGQLRVLPFLPSLCYTVLLYYYTISDCIVLFTPFFSTRFVFALVPPLLFVFGRREFTLDLSRLRSQEYVSA